MTNDYDGNHAQVAAPPPRGLSYLDAGSLDIGSIGVFAGDWARTGTPARVPSA